MYIGAATAYLNHFRKAEIIVVTIFGLVFQAIDLEHLSARSARLIYMSIDNFISIESHCQRSISIVIRTDWAYDPECQY